MSAHINYRALPVGATLTFVSKKGNRFVVRLVEGTLSGACKVEVVEAPVKYEGDVYMCVVSSTARIKIMTHAYANNLPTVAPGDVVYLIDMEQSHNKPVRPFEVREVVVN